MKKAGKEVKKGAKKMKPQVSKQTTTEKGEANTNKFERRIKKGSVKRRRTELSTQEAEVTKSKQSYPEFRRVFQQYNESITVIREFFSELSPYISEMEEGIIKSRFEILNKKSESIMAAFNENATKEDKDDLEKLIEDIGKKISKSKIPKQLLIGKQRPRIQRLLIDVTNLVRYVIAPPMRHELLNRGILMCLVSDFEVLISDLVHLYYFLEPDATSSDDKVLSVNELREFSSIEDAFQFLITRRVDDLLRGSIFDWNNFFKNRMKVDFNNITPSLAELNEFLQRRHIMVHAGGRVTKRYLEKVDWDKLPEGITRPDIDQKLKIDDSYLERGINLFEITGLLFCQEVWKKLAPQESALRMSFNDGLNGVVYQRLLSHNWYIAEHLADWGRSDSNADSEYSILLCTFNRWLCIKRQGRWLEIEKEVEAFDTSAKQNVFSLVKASLLEKVDEFFKLLAQEIGTGVEIDQAKGWPILDDMRADPRFTEIIEAAEKKIGQ